jgi:hypothetical protein
MRYGSNMNAGNNSHGHSAETTPAKFGGAGALRGFSCLVAIGCKGAHQTRTTLAIGAPYKPVR